MKKEKKRSIVSNVRYLNHLMFERYPSARPLLVIYMIAAILVPFTDTLLPSVAVSMVMTKDIRGFVVGMLGILLVTLVIRIANTVGDQVLFGQRVCTRLFGLTRMLIERVIRTDYPNVESQPKQVWIEKAAQSIAGNNQGAEKLMKSWVVFVIQVVGMVSYGTAVFMLDVRILLIMLVMFLSNYLLCRHAIHWGERNRESITNCNRQKNYLEESSQSLVYGKDVRIYQMESWFRDKYNVVMKNTIQWQKSHELRWYFPTISDTFFVAARDLLAYILLINLARKGAITPAVFTLYLGVISGFSRWMNQVVEAISSLKQSNSLFNDYHVVMEWDQEEQNPDECDSWGAVVPRLGESVQVEFDDVSFRYEGATKDSLSHISFKMQKGEKIALVGNNGAGKTTLVKLLLGLYQPTQGEIRLNDIPISQYKKEEYQRFISVLFQDYEALSFTIASNVSGKCVEDTDKERLKESLILAGLWEKVEHLPNGVNTYLTQTLDDGGVLLSGGETQRLLLARAIYKNGSLLVLDEPTSALDPIAESRMYQEYNRLTRNKTSLFISHRLASTRFCDRILFLDDGKICEEGTHEALVGLGKMYAEMFEIQSHYYKEVANHAE